MTYTLEDHALAPLKYPRCRAGHVWHQHGNTTGHCSRCHETFEGISLFDAHQRTGEDGRTICLQPAEMTYRGVPLRLEDGSWRGPGMPLEEIERRKALRATPGPEEAVSQR